MAQIADRISPIRLNHMNLVLEEFEESLARFERLYGAILVHDLPNAAEFRAGLVEMGGGLFEFFVPRAWLLNARYGPFHLGVEYQADMDMVRKVLAANRIRIVRDIGAAVHTHPADTFGVSWEFYGAHFRDRVWPRLDRALLPQSYWRDEHPLGMTGLMGFTLAVEDMARALSQMQALFATAPRYDEPRPALAARAVGLLLGDSLVELQMPTGPGALREYLARRGEGLAATIFGVRDIGQAERYFADRGIPVVPGSAPASLAVSGAANGGVTFEFRADAGDG